MKKHLALLLSFGFFVINIFLLPDYGLSWDEPEHYLRGQAYLRFFLAGKKDYQDLPRLKIHRQKNFYTQVSEDDYDFEDDRLFRRSLFQNDYLGFSYFLEKDGGHPPLSDILASFFNFLFYQKLGLVADIESYHLFIVLVSSLLVGLVFLFTAELYGLFAGVIAAFSLALYPLFLAESHFNIKDPVETSFYAFTISSFYQGIVKNSPRWLIISSLFCGFALGTKFNIFFAALTLLLWLLIHSWPKIKSLQWPFNKKMTFSLLAYPLIALALFFSFWPFLWQAPYENFLKIAHYYQQIGLATYQPKEYYPFLGFNTYALQWILYATPLVILFFSLIGIITVLRRWRKERNAPSLLILLWFLVPILRVTLPKMGIYGGVRQIMEFIPAMAILAGLGAQTLRKKLSLVIGHWSLVIVLLMFLPITLKMIQIHPNQNVYFNPLIGGLKGAKERNLPGWGVTLGSVYQQGMDWLNQNAEEEANVALVQGLMSNIPRIKIRKDINFGERYWSGEQKKGEYLLEVTDSSWEDVPDEKRLYLKTLKPVHEVKVDEVAILKIWKND